MSKLRKIIIIILLVCSFDCFVALTVYNKVINLVEEKHGCTKEDYNNTTNGMKYIETLPMALLLNNKEFSEDNFLDNESATKIVVAYHYKHKLNIKTCTDKSINTNFQCIKANDLDTKKIFNKDFDLSKTNFYFYDHVKVEVKYVNDDGEDYYYFLPDISTILTYQSYSSFDEYEIKNNEKTYKVRQGYIFNNSSSGNDYILANYSSGSEIYTLKLNSKVDIIQEFEKNQDSFIGSLATYEYVLGENENGYYLKTFSK